MKIMMMVVMAMAIKCSAWKRRKRKIKWAQGKDEIHRVILFW
jgi:hypothetical protein